MSDWPQQEEVGGYSFRARPCEIVRGWTAEAIKGKFSARNIIEEDAGSECWFEFAQTGDDAIAKLKREIFN